MKTKREKQLARQQLAARLADHRAAGQTIVFTNGCFDLLHVGHLRLLTKAKDHGDVLVLAINSDESVRSLNKGDQRPVHPEEERAELLAALRVVDYVTVFSEETPAEILSELQPDILVKGGDWGENEIVGRDILEARGGKVIRVSPVPGKSTTDMIEKIRRMEKNSN